MSNESTDLKRTETGANEAPHQVRRENSPDHSIHADGSVATATIHDRTSLYLAIIAMVLSALCLGLFLMQTFLMPQIIDAKVAAGMAQAQATAVTANQHARVALDKVEDFRTKLAAKGIDVPPLDGH
jgi:hypothetical protein